MQLNNSQRWKVTLLCLGLALLVVLTFLPVLENDFIFYDDPSYISDNPHVLSGLRWENIKWAMGSTVVGNWHPLTWLSHMLDCQLFGLNPRGHHLMSLLIHAVNTVLVLLVLEGMTGAVWRSVLVAAMFGLHPLHVESVAWASERKDVLCTFFFLLALWAYVRHAQEVTRGQGQVPGKGKPLPTLFMSHFTFHVSRFYWLALFLFALSLMSKPMLVTLPFLLLLLDYWPLNRFSTHRRRELVVEKTPFFLLSIAVCLVTIPAQKAAGGVRTMTTFSLPVRLENALVSYGRYLGKLFWPENLPFFYPHPGHWPWIDVLGAGLLVSGLFLGAWMMRRRQPYFLVGWCWFVGTLVPVIGLLQVGFQSIANRYMYVPSIGIFLCLAWGGQALTKRWRHQSLIGFTLMAAAILACIPLTRLQIGYWKNSEILFQYASVVIKNNWEAHARLGLVFSKEDRLDEAIREYRESLRLKPDNADTHFDLGNALSRKKMWGEAISQYRESLKLNPDDPGGHVNLGVALFQQGNLDDAIFQFQEALRLKPDFAGAGNNLAAALRAKNASRPAAVPGPDQPPPPPAGR